MLPGSHPTRGRISDLGIPMNPEIEWDKHGAYITMAGFRTSLTVKRPALGRRGHSRGAGPQRPMSDGVALGNPRRSSRRWQSRRSLARRSSRLFGLRSRSAPRVPYARSCRRPAEQAERRAAHVEAQAKLNGFTTLSNPARRFASRPRLRGTRPNSQAGFIRNWRAQGDSNPCFRRERATS